MPIYDMPTPTSENPLSRKDTHMNKLLAGAVAGAAGVALLVGGAGTFALWNSTATVNVGTVSSGTLLIAASGTPSWKDISSDGPLGGTVISTISDYRIVPGDTLQLTQEITVDATGNNLTATLSYDDASIVAATAADAALKSELVFAMDATGGANVTRIGTGNTFAVTPASGQSIVTLTVTIDLSSTVSGTTAQGGTVDFSTLSFKLAQDAR